MCDFAEIIVQKRVFVNKKDNKKHKNTHERKDTFLLKKKSSGSTIGIYVLEQKNEMNMWNVLGFVNKLYGRIKC